MSDQELGEERAPTEFLVKLSDLDDDQREQLVNVTMPAGLGPHDHGEIWRHRMRVLSGLLERFSVRLLDNGTAHLLDAQREAQVASIGPGKLTVRVAANGRSVLMRLPTDLLGGQDVAIGFKRREALALAEQLLKGCEEIPSEPVEAPPEMTDEQLLAAVPKWSPGIERQTFNDWRDKLHPVSYRSWHDYHPDHRRAVYLHCSGEAGARTDMDASLGPDGPALLATIYATVVRGHQIRFRWDPEVRGIRVDVTRPGEALQGGIVPMGNCGDEHAYASLIRTLRGDR